MFTDGRNIDAGEFTYAWKVIIRTKFYREMPKPKENHWIRNQFTLWEGIRAIRNKFTKNLCESKTTSAFRLRLLSWLCCNLNWMSCTISLYVSRARGNFVSFEGLVWKKLMWIIHRFVGKIVNSHQRLIPFMLRPYLFWNVCHS